MVDVVDPARGIVIPITPGAAKEVRRTIPGIPEGQTVVSAWLFSKRRYSDPDTEFIIIKAIDSADRAGTGQIENGRNEDGEAIVRFDLLPENTILLVPLLRAPFVIWAETSEGTWSRYPAETGEFEPGEAVNATIDFPQPGP